MLASPLLIGVLAAGPAWVHLPLALFWFVGYFGFFATGLWLRSRRRPRYRTAMLTYLTASLACGAVVLAIRPSLAVWAPLFVVPFGVGLWASAHRRDRALVSGLATTVGASLMTVVAYDAGGGTDWAWAWWLAGLQSAYFAGTVLYVKSMIRERGNDAFRRLSIGYHVAVPVVLLGSGLVGVAPVGRTALWAQVVVFLALAVRAAGVPRLVPAPTPKRIGIGEILATVTVALASLLVR